MLGSARYALGVATLVAVASATALLAAQQPSSRATDHEVKQLLTRIEKNAQLFRYSLAQTSNQEWLVGVQPGNIDVFVTSFVDATRQLRDHFDRGHVVTTRVDEVLRRGASIDSFMEHRRSPDQADQDWLSVRRDLDALARAYNATWNLRTPRPSLTTAAYAAR